MQAYQSCSECMWLYSHQSWKDHKGWYPIRHWKHSSCDNRSCGGKENENGHNLKARFTFATNSTKIVPFQYERSTFTVFFFKNKCVIFTMDKANGKTKTPEPPSPFSFAKEYRQWWASDHDFERGCEPGAFFMPSTQGRGWRFRADTKKWKDENTLWIMKYSKRSS